MCTHTSFTCSDRFIKKAKEDAKKLNAPMQFHLCESIYEPNYAEKHFGKKAVDYYNDLDILDETVLASQCVKVNDEEIDILKEKGVKVVHMPLSNCEVGGGFSPVPKMIKKGIKVALGTDGYINDFFEVMRGAFLMHKSVEEDASVMPANLVLEQIGVRKDIEKNIQFVLERVGIPLSLLSLWKSGERKMVLITGHRRENFGEGFIHICKAIKTLAEKYSMVDFVYPMHLNPNVRKPIAEILGESHKETLTNVFLIEPLDYLPFVYLMNHSTIVLTDSGGIQEEAPGLGKPVLVMRDTTERPEALEAGTVKLVGTGYNSIIDNVSDLLENKDLYRQMSKAQNPYGDGKTSQSIVNILL